MNTKAIGGIILIIALLLGALYFLQPSNPPLPVVEQLPEQIIETEEPTVYLFDIPVDLAVKEGLYLLIYKYLRVKHFRSA